MGDFFEMLMVLSFGISWPVSIVKTWKSKSVAGKSILFSVFIWIGLFFASTFSSKMQIEFLKVAWGISPVLHFLRRHSFRCRRGAVAGIQSLLVTDM